MSHDTEKDWSSEPPAVVAFVTGVLVLIGYIVHEVMIYAQSVFTYGLDPLVRIFWSGATDFAKTLVGGIGAEATSITLISTVAIPVTIVSTYTIFRKAKEKSKALIVAVSLFLDPLFIDFFKDAYGEHDALKKILIDASGVVTFLAASYFWSLSNVEEKPGVKRSTRSIFCLRGGAIILFLIPSLAMLGFIAHKAAGNWSAFLQAFTPEEIIGLAGLLVVATVGIVLSRYFEGL
ncbi:MAG TPA: hypothetical protein VGG56_11620 [Terracidiphilus sp.]|jgi:hypothetical protein